MATCEYESEVKTRDETIRQQAELISEQSDRLKQLEAEIARLKELLGDKADAKAAKKPTFTEDYSFGKKQGKRKRRKKSTGRRRNDVKRAMIEDECDIYWEGVDREQCVLHREQFAWRLVDGKAVYICYNIYDLPDSKELPLPPGLRNSRSEFGIEIILTLAFLVLDLVLGSLLAQTRPRFRSG